MSGAWVIASSRLRLMTVCGAEERRRVLALDAVLVEEADAASARSPSAPYSLRADQHESDARVVGEAVEQPRVQLLELLDRQAMVVAGEPHQAEVARTDDDDRRLIGRRRDLLRVEIDDAIRRLAGQGGPGDASVRRPCCG